MIEEGSAEEHDPVAGTWTYLGSARHKPPRFIVQDTLPEGLSFIGGEAKCNKSTITAALAAMIADLKCKALPPWMSIVRDHGPVLWFSAEEDAGGLRHLLEAGLHIPVPPTAPILVADDPFEWRLDTEEDMRKLWHWLDSLKPKLTIIDPMSDFHQLEEKDSAAMIRILRPLRQWALAHHSAIVMVHHTRKMDQNNRGGLTRPSDLRGSSAIFGKLDAALMVTKLDNGTHNIHATFKRGSGWERKIQMRAFDQEMPAREVLDARAIEVLRVLEDVPASRGFLLKQFKSSNKAKMTEVLDLLRRNNLIERVPDSQAWIATRSRKELGLE
jgi:hypothetical protein